MKNTVVKMYVVDADKIQVKSREIVDQLYLVQWLPTEHGRWVYERAENSLKTHAAYDAFNDQFKVAITAKLSSDDQLMHKLKWE
jgi:hypothetical protein